MPGLFFQPPPPPVIGGGRLGPVGKPNNSRLPPIAVPEQASPLPEPAACEPAPAELSSAACAVRLQRSPVLGVCMGAGDAAGKPSQPRLSGPARLSAAAQPPPAAGAVSSSPPLPPIQGPPPVMLHAQQKTSPSVMIPSPPRNRAPLRASAIFPTQPTPALGNAFRWRMGEKHSVDRLQKMLAAMSPDEFETINLAAARLQRRWRECQQKVLVEEYTRAAYSQPDLEKAKKHAVGFLPKDRHGHLFPLTAPLKAFHPLGCGVALYIHLLRWWSGFLLLGTMLYLPSMSINMQGNALNTTGVFTAIQAIHTLGNADELTLAHVATELVVVSALVWFMFWQSAKTKHLSARITHHDLSAANYTVMVGRMPVGLTDSRLTHEYFARWGDVVHVGLSLNYRDVLVSAQERKQLRQKLYNSQVEWYLAKANSLPKKKVLRAARARARAKHRLYAAETNLSALSGLEYTCTGYAFVTFDTVDAASECIADCRDKERYFERSGPLTAKMAPEPDDILWENLQYSNLERWARSALASCIALALVAGSTFIILYSALVQQSEAAGIETVVLSLAGTGMLVCGYVVIFATVPLMAFKLERYQTSSSRERAIHLKLFCFQALVTILPAVWFCEVSLHPFSIYLGRQFYTAGTKILVGGIVGDAFVINLLVDLGRPQDRFSRWQARRARTQRQMNSLWKCPGDLYIAFRQQLVSKWIVLVLMFSSLVPALVPLTFLFFFIANWVDRFNLLRHLAPPPPQDDSIMRQLVQILLPIGVLLHMAVACTAYAMKEGRIGPGTTCTIAIAAVYTPLTLFFFYREHRSRHGMAPSSLRVGRRLGALIEHYLDLPYSEGGGRRLGVSPSNVHSETFRESNDLPFYIPPLSAALLQALGADTTLSVTTRRNRGSAAMPVRGPLGTSQGGDDGYSAGLDFTKHLGRGTRVVPMPTAGPHNPPTRLVTNRPDEHTPAVRARSRSERSPADEDEDARRPQSVEPDRSVPSRSATPSPLRHARSMSMMVLPAAPRTELSRAKSGRWSHHYTDHGDADSPRADGHAAFQPNRTAPPGAYG